MKEEHERTPLRTILQNFLNHIESLEIQRIEDSYEKEFQVLLLFRRKSQNFCNTYPHQIIIPCLIHSTTFCVLLTSLIVLCNLVTEGYVLI